jgi:hypothetical protein
MLRISIANDIKTRILVLTDIENEPDDAMSMVRFLTYANEFDVEGLVATTSCWQRDQIADWRIREIVEAYGKVQDNLLKHAPGYPSNEKLLNLIKRGYPDFGMKAVGDDKNSEGSDWIIEVVDRPDPRPVWVTVWGGANCLAQALYKVKQTRSEKDLKTFIKKLRVYTISDQDDSGPWMRETFPDLFYIVSPGFEENGGGGYHYATWPGISGDKFHGRFRGPDFSLVSNETLDENIRKNHGPLGAEYPWVKYLMEGDTPSFLYLIPNGLSDPEHPNYGSWGGRYELYTPRKQKWHYQQEIRPIWTDAVDEVLAPDGFHYTSNHATIWRWREAYQHDFFARMDWCVKSFEEANHPPVVQLKHSSQMEVKSGEPVRLSAEGSKDPDGDKLSYHWIYYREPSTYLGMIKFEVDSMQKVDFEAPKVEKEVTLHFILSVRDTGLPELTRYQRVIVTVLPKF